MKQVKGREREYIAFFNAVLKAKDNYETMKKEKPKQLKKDIEKIADSVIERWYDSYEPKLYKRTGAIKTAYKIEIHGLNVSIDMDPSYMSSNYHQSDELVYNTVFLEGYHGGSRGVEKKTGIDAGPIPRWRTPNPQYKHWYLEAPRSFSPYMEIDLKSQERFEKYNKEWELDFDRKVYNPVERIMKSLLNN